MTKLKHDKKHEFISELELIDNSGLSDYQHCIIKYTCSQIYYSSEVGFEGGDISIESVINEAGEKVKVTPAIEAQIFDAISFETILSNE